MVGAEPLNTSMPDTLMIVPSPLATMPGTARASIVGATTLTWRSSFALSAGSSMNGMLDWEFERQGEVIKLDPTGPLIVQAGTATDLAIGAAVAGCGVIHLFEDWLRPNLDASDLEPILEPWWLRFSGPFLYYPSRRYVPAPLRAFIEFIRRGEIPSPNPLGAKLTKEHQPWSTRAATAKPQ